MPLPSVLKYGAKRCHAMSKSTRQQCGNPACLGSTVCRYHGYRKPETILRNEEHPNYVHGERSIEGIKRHREVMGRIKMLTKLAKDLKMLK